LHFADCSLAVLVVAYGAAVHWFNRCPPSGNAMVERMALREFNRAGAVRNLHSNTEGDNFRDLPPFSVPFLIDDGCPLFALSNVRADRFPLRFRREALEGGDGHHDLERDLFGAFGPRHSLTPIATDPFADHHDRARNSQLCSPRTRCGSCHQKTARGQNSRCSALRWQEVHWRFR
jgi:hypothetical protein